MNVLFLLSLEKFSSKLKCIIYFKNSLYSEILRDQKNMSNLKKTIEKTANKVQTKLRTRKPSPGKLLFTKYIHVHVLNVFFKPVKV